MYKEQKIASEENLFVGIEHLSKEELEGRIEK